jgi:hypothetical protein
MFRAKHDEQIQVKMADACIMDKPYIEGCCGTSTLPRSILWLLNF